MRAQLDTVTLNGKIVSRSKNLRGIYRYAGQHQAKEVRIAELPARRGKLTIDFENDAHFETEFESYEILKTAVSRWRNLRGASCWEGQHTWTHSGKAHFTIS